MKEDAQPSIGPTGTRTFVTISRRTAAPLPMAVRVLARIGVSSSFTVCC